MLEDLGRSDRRIGTLGGDVLSVSACPQRADDIECGPAGAQVGEQRGVVVPRVRERDGGHDTFEVEGMQPVTTARTTADTEPAHMGEGLLGVRQEVFGELTIREEGECGPHRVTRIPFGTTVTPPSVTVKPRARSCSWSMPTWAPSSTITFLSRIARLTTELRLM